MLDSALLQSFCTGFFGYGTPDAAYWFITMEEGGGNTEAEIATRLEVWNQRGRHELEEVHEYSRAIGLGKWFDPHPPIQPTWAAAIRMVLTMEGLSASTEAVRAYQRDRLARQGGSTRLSPLFPLPSKSLDHWNYGSWTGDGALADRAAYKRRFESERIVHLSRTIQQLAPKTVAFFGASYTEYWNRITDTSFATTESGFQIASKGGTRFVICNHPGSRGIKKKNAYFVSAALALNAD